MANNIKKSQLKQLIKEVTKIYLKENDNLSWKPYTNVLKWEMDNVDAKTGEYKGEPLKNYGFQYKVGDVVPLDKGFRNLAMKNWNDAKKRAEANRALGKPAGYPLNETVNLVSPDGNDLYLKMLDIANLEDPSYRLIGALKKAIERRVKNSSDLKVLIDTFNSEFGGYHIEQANRFAKKEGKPPIKDAWEYYKEENLKETTTGMVAGYQIPAWGSKSKRGSEAGIKGSEKLGFTPVTNKLGNTKK